jgi:hypothetical protein
MGCTTKPEKPFPKPVTKPDAPPSIAPIIGFLKTPIAPLTTPYQKK